MTRGYKATAGQGLDQENTGFPFVTFFCNPSLSSFFLQLLRVLLDNPDVSPTDNPAAPTGANSHYCLGALLAGARAASLRRASLTESLICPQCAGSDIPNTNRNKTLVSNTLSLRLPSTEMDHQQSPTCRTTQDNLGRKQQGSGNGPEVFLSALDLMCFWSDARDVFVLEELAQTHWPLGKNTRRDCCRSHRLRVVTTVLD